MPRRGDAGVAGSTSRSRNDGKGQKSRNYEYELTAQHTSVHFLVTKAERPTRPQRPFSVQCILNSCLMRLLQNFCKLTPPPLTGGGWGVGEAATCRFHGKLPPHPTPPPQGGRGFFGLLQEAL